MMNSPNRTLIVEIRTVERSQFNSVQTSPLIVYQDASSNYYLATGNSQIERAILAAVPRLGSNYRHPLLFDVQVISSNKIDAFFASVKQSPNSRPRVRRTRS